MDVVPVEYRSAGNGEGHHDDEVGEEGEGAEDQVGPLPESSLDHLNIRGPGLGGAAMDTPS